MTLSRPSKLEVSAFSALAVPAPLSQHKEKRGRERKGGVPYRKLKGVDVNLSARPPAARWRPQYSGIVPNPKHFSAVSRASRWRELKQKQTKNRPGCTAVSAAPQKTARRRLADESAARPTRADLRLGRIAVGGEQTLAPSWATAAVGFAARSRRSEKVW